MLFDKAQIQIETITEFLTKKVLVQMRLVAL